MSAVGIPALDRPSIADEFFTGTNTLSKVQLEWFLRRNDVPAMALAFDGDGRGWCIRTARVERVGSRFAFLEDGVGAFVAVARDEDGIGRDLVAWEPREGWTAPWLGDLPILGQHELLTSPVGGVLQVHRTMLTWLRGGRIGVVILAPGEARRLLEGMTLQADDLEHGIALRRTLTPPTPRIMVKPAPMKQVAA